jgi:very-short-patch-repair endonuclease
MPAWNKGLKAETNPSVAAYTQKSAKSRKGQNRKPLSEATKRKLSEDRRGDKNWAKRPEVREKIRQSVIQMYRDHPEVLENRKRSGVNQHSGYFSSLERLIADALCRASVPYQHNVRIGRYWADFVICGRIVIECDGAYWHQDEAKDKRKDHYLQERGYFVYRFAEHRILHDPDLLVTGVLVTYEPFAETVVLDGCSPCCIG